MIYDLPVETSIRPADWTIQPLKRVADVIGGGTPDTTVAEYWNPPEIPWVTPTDITECSEPVLTQTERAISQSGLRGSSATLLPTGTTLLTSRATVGECRLAGLPVATNQGFASLVPKEGTDARFLFYLAQTLKPTFVRLAAGTTFVEVSRREIRRVNVCVPSQPNERAAIGRVLTLTDEALATAEAQHLAARRQKVALMQQLFTRGIPGCHHTFRNARVFRHTFEVPESWNVDPLRCSITSVDYGTNEPSSDARHGLPVVAIPEVIAPRFRLGECSYAEVPDQEALALRLEPNDVLLIRTNGNSEYIGKSTVIGDEAAHQHIIFASYLIRVRTNKEKASGRYLNYFLASPLGRRQCLAMANTSAGNHNLGARSIKQFCFPCPSPKEQEEIVGLVDSAEDAIESAQLQIASLRRLKQALLHNLLTGRMRVRI
ncbi:MAG: restriction endonuclease subunit S [Candidatus Acidiferrales bacterium]